MNKVMTVNIGGFVFHVEEDAYASLQNYLASVARQFGNTEEQAEIMADVESRLAEIFQQELKKLKTEVVVMAQVQKAIEVMGRPEDYVEESNESQNYTTGRAERPYNRLFRNPDDRILGGVCSGMAAKLDIDPLWLRLAFVLLAFAMLGTLLLLYILLWIIIPPAMTAAEKLEMRGQKVTIDNLHRSVKDEYEGVKKKFNELTDDPINRDVKERSRNFFNEAGSAIERLFKALVYIIGKLIGVFLIFFGFVLIFALVASFVGVSIEVPYFLSWLHLALFENQTLNWLMIASLILFIAIPAFLLMWAGIKILISRPTPVMRPVIISLALIWLVSGMYSFSSAAMLKNEYSYKEEVEQEVELAEFKGDTLYIHGDVFGMGNTKTNIHFGNANSRVSTINGNLYFGPIITSSVSPDSSFHLTVNKSSWGRTPEQAVYLASSIVLSVQQDSNILKLNNVPKITDYKTWRGQNIELKILVPEGKTIQVIGDAKKHPFKKGAIKSGTITSMVVI